MITNQYSIIILRNDMEADLPGAPVTLSPLVYEPALEPGEPVVTQDTGRMFVGHSPTVGQRNFRRTSFPFQNIEVLTENSTDTLKQMMGGIMKEADGSAFYTTSLPPAASLTPVTVPMQGETDYAYRLNNAQSLAAFVDYAAFDSNQKPVRMGRLLVMQGTGNATPVCSDNGVNLGSSLLTFSATETGPTGGRYVVINYRYTGAGNLTLRFRVTRPTA